MNDQIVGDFRLATGFAFLPKRLHNGKLIWLRRFKRLQKVIVLNYDIMTAPHWRKFDRTTKKKWVTMFYYGYSEENPFDKIHHYCRNLSRSADTKCWCGKHEDLFSGNFK